MPVTINGTTGVQNVLGSASAPAESNTSSSNTGLYFPTSTTLGLATNGTAALNIDASQNVGIGTTSLNLSASTRALTINSPNAGDYPALEFSTAGTLRAYMNATNGAFYIVSQSTNPMIFYTNASERMRIDSSGNVGIGTSSPANKLDVSGSISDSIGNVRSIPQNSQTGAYVLVATDNGKHISITTGGVTVPASVFSAGQVVSVYNNSGSSQTITQGATVTLRQAGTANTGNRTLAQYGLCTILCVASNTFVISGSGLT